MRPSGLRVIDLVEGDGPLPALGDRVYVHIKVWGSSFDAGEPAYATWAADGRPSMWFLGEPSAVVVGPPYVPTTTVPAHAGPLRGSTATTLLAQAATTSRRVGAVG